MGKTDAEINELAMTGWIAAATAYDGLKAAGPDFDRAKVISASNEKLTAYTADGIHPPIDFSRQHEPPTAGRPGRPRERPRLLRLRQDPRRRVLGGRQRGEALDLLARRHPGLVGADPHDLRVAGDWNWSLVPETG